MKFDYLAQMEIDKKLNTPLDKQSILLVYRIVRDNTKDTTLARAVHSQLHQYGTMLEEQKRINEQRTKTIPQKLREIADSLDYE